jgi:plastocyanin
MKASRGIALLAVTTISACGGYSGTSPASGGQDTPPPGAAEVSIQDFAFTPKTVTIKVGTAVHWTNLGPSAHTTTSDTGLWDSGLLAAGTGGGGGSGGGGGGYNGAPAMMAGAFTFTFTQPGTYTYHCTSHPPSMYPNFTGTVTVTP